MPGIVYSSLFVSGLLASSPYWLWRAWKKRELHLISDRLGLNPWPRPAGRADGGGAGAPDRVWVHAVSVGEVQAARPILRALRRTRPDLDVWLSVTTKTGLKVGADAASDIGGVFGPLVFPLDVPWAVGRRLAEAAPRAIVFLETEIWPNLITAASRRGTNLFLANGRISDRSFGRYRHFRWYLRPLLDRFSFFWMQSATDADRLIAMGAPAGRVAVAGNLKIDALLERNVGKNQPDARDGFPAFLAASTHAGEEDVVLRAAKFWRDAGRNFRLAIAPRHPERAGEVKSRIESFGFRPVLRSSGGTLPETAADVLLIDTIGELMDFFPRVRAVFVGGSLASFGGHNIFEPAAFGRPVLFGPHMENFREAAEALLGRGGIQIAGESAFEPEAAAVLFDPARAESLGKAARCSLESRGGAAERIVRELAKAVTGPVG